MNPLDDYRLTVDGAHSFERNSLNVASLDAVRLDETTYHVNMAGQSVLMEVSKVDFDRKEITVKIDGVQHLVAIEDGYDLLVKKMGLSVNVLHKISEVKAPMPGLVLGIEVTVGQELVHGQPILVLEAMKMENVIKSPGEGIVKSIRVSKGNPVEKGQVLVELE